MWPGEQRGSGGRDKDGGLRVAEERKGQDVYKEEQEGEQAPWGLCANWKRCLSPRADATPGQVPGSGKPPSPSHAVNSLHHHVRDLKAKQPRKQSRCIQETGSETRKCRALQEIDDECHCVRNDLANVGMRPPS